MRTFDDHLKEQEIFRKEEIALNGLECFSCRQMVLRHEALNVDFVLNHPFCEDCQTDETIHSVLKEKYGPLTEEDDRIIMEEITAGRKRLSACLK